MSVLRIVLMVAAVVGAIGGMRLSKAGVKLGRFLTVGCVILAMVLAVMGLVSSNDETPKLIKSLNRYSYASGETLGRHLAEAYSGSRVLILVQPTFPGEEPDPLQVSIQEGLKQGMGSALELVDIVPAGPPDGYVERVIANTPPELKPPPGTPEGWIPALERDYNRWFNARFFATILAAHKGTYDVLVSAVGLPRDFANSRMANHPDLPEIIAVLNAPDLPMKRLIQDGTVDLLVAEKPSANPWADAENAPEEIAEAFARRYILVTRDNVDEIAATYPNLANWR